MAAFPHTLSTIMTSKDESFRKTQHQESGITNTMQHRSSSRQNIHTVKPFVTPTINEKIECRFQKSPVTRLYILSMKLTNILQREIMKSSMTRMEIWWKRQTEIYGMTASNSSLALKIYCYKLKPQTEGEKLDQNRSQTVTFFK